MQGHISFGAQVFEAGSLYDPAVLDITDDDLLSFVKAGISNVTALSLATGVATLAAVPHLVINGFKNVLAVALECDYSFPIADKVSALPQAPTAMCCGWFQCMLCARPPFASARKLEHWQ